MLKQARTVARSLSVLFTIFISLFALDVFTEGYGIGQTIVALFFHLIPSFLLAGALALAWERERLGGAVFIILGLFSSVFFHTYRHIVSMMAVTLPALVIGGLFLWSGLKR